MSMWTIYLITRLDNIQQLFIIVISMIAGLFFFDLLINGLDGNRLFFKKYYKLVLPIWLIVLIGFIIIPTQKEAAAIWLIPKIVNNEKIQNISADSLDIIRVEAKEYLTDLVNVKKSKAR